MMELAFNRLKGRLVRGLILSSQFAHFLRPSLLRWQFP
jgi:hypothetical protein